MKRKVIKYISLLLVLISVLSMPLTVCAATGTTTGGTFPISCSISEYPFDSEPAVDAQALYTEYLASNKYYVRDYPDFFQSYGALSVCVFANKEGDICFFYTLGNLRIINIDGGTSEVYSESTMLSVGSDDIGHFFYVYYDVSTQKYKFGLFTGNNNSLQYFYPATNPFFYSTMPLLYSDNSIIVANSASTAGGFDVDEDYFASGKQDRENIDTSMSDIEIEDYVTEDEDTNFFSRTFSNILIAIKNVGAYVSGFWSTVQDAFNYISSTLVTKISEVSTPIVTAIETWIGSVFSTVTTISDEITGFFTDFYTKLKEVSTEIFDAIWNYEVIEDISLHSIYEYFAEKIEAVITEIQSVVTAVQENVSGGISSAVSLFDSLESMGTKDGMESFSIFNIIEIIYENTFEVDEEFKNTKLTEIKENVTLIRGTIDMREALNSTINDIEAVAPVFTISAGNYGKYFNVQEDIMINFDFLTPYKSTYDIIIAAFMYVGFGLYIIKQLPNVIKGFAAPVETERSINGN